MYVYDDVCMYIFNTPGVISEENTAIVCVAWYAHVSCTVVCAHALYAYVLCTVCSV